jgi:hypothetical protein
LSCPFLQSVTMHLSVIIYVIWSACFSRPCVTPPGQTPVLFCFIPCSQRTQFRLSIVLQRCVSIEWMNEWTGIDPSEKYNRFICSWLQALRPAPDSLAAWFWVCTEKHLQFLTSSLTLCA